MAFDLEQLFQISLEYRLCLNHRIEGFLHSGRQIICIDVLPLQFFLCHRFAFEGCARLGSSPTGIGGYAEAICNNGETSELFRLGSIILYLLLQGTYSGYAFHSQRACTDLCSTPWGNRTRRDGGNDLRHGP
jgi:hypothetical protein